MPMGGTELLIILAIILLLFGASRVPQLGRSLGQSLREFRKEASEDSEETRELKERRELPREEEAPAKEARTRTEHEDISDERRTERA
jgi:sec-independent protein translocase protein TatA